MKTTTYNIASILVYTKLLKSFVGNWSYASCFLSDVFQGNLPILLTIHIAICLKNLEVVFKDSVKSMKFE